MVGILNIDSQVSTESDCGGCILEPVCILWGLYTGTSMYTVGVVYWNQYVDCKTHSHTCMIFSMIDQESNQELIYPCLGIGMFMYHILHKY